MDSISISTIHNLYYNGMFPLLFKTGICIHTLFTCPHLKFSVIIVMIVISLISCIWALIQMLGTQQLFNHQWLWLNWCIIPSQFIQKPVQSQESTGDLEDADTKEHKLQDQAQAQRPLSQTPDMCPGARRAKRMKCEVCGSALVSIIHHHTHRFSSS